MTATTSPASPSAEAASALPDAVDAITTQWAEVRPDLETVPMAVYGRIYRIARAMGDRMDKEYARFGIGRGEFDVIATLRRSGEPYTLSPRQLSGTLMLTTGGMTGRLDKLEKAGLLVRSPDPTDRRGLRVTLTERGLKLVDESVTAGLAAQREVLGSALDEDEAAQLSSLLRKLLAAH
ncbi:MarR family winged helix-turn-helix transcriptional regulator [Streptomyces sp. NBC_00083]|uniref:MarR family winged helix-turn-helix transcriptional regulator n=1 Tax=Streptomyces sp. NBC_00083 TaxID=2975647 RepID=UPI00224FA620|nr:MarR family transcriptional regulator [Streptomyces sp. NBC_00083]MCX5382405.1 MarR family transcriptional regulator [Streptomyces sp. NBC_00083]